ncbi:MAG: DUF4430 domain-containing protein [Candidatus Saccharimonadales bacterium]
MLNNINKQKLVGIFTTLMIVVALGILGAYAFNQYQANQSNGDTVSEEETIQESVEISLNYGDGEDSEIYYAQYKSGMSVFEALESASELNDFELEYTDYGGDLGVFVESINGYSGGDDKWWQFWVNDEYQTSGMSSVIVSSGDIIELRLTGE